MKKRESAYSPFMTAEEWRRLREMKDEDIDTSDIPELTEDDFKKMRILYPTKD